MTKLLSQLRGASWFRGFRDFNSTVGRKSSSCSQRTRGHDLHWRTSVHLHYAFIEGPRTVAIIVTPEPGASALAESSGKCGVSGLNYGLALPNGDLYTSAHLLDLGPCSEVLRQWRGSAPTQSLCFCRQLWSSDFPLSHSNGQPSPGCI